MHSDERCCEASAMMSTNLPNVQCVLLRTLLRDTVLSTFYYPVRRCTRVWGSNRLPPSLWTNAALWAKLRRLSGTHVRDVKRTHFTNPLQDALRHCTSSYGSTRTTLKTFLTSFNTTGNDAPTICSAAGTCFCGSSKTTSKTSSTSFKTATAPRQAQACTPKGSWTK